MNLFPLYFVIHVVNFCKVIRLFLNRNIFYRTKFIQIEENLKVAGVHKGTLGVPGSVSYNVPESIGYYLHYRGCTEFFLKENPTLLNGANCLNNYSSRVQNTDARNRFGPQLESRVNRKVTMLVELGHVDKKWLKTFSIIKK